METPNTSSGKGRIAWILLILSLIGNIVQWRSNVSSVESYQIKTDSLISARVDVEKEMDATKEELNKYQGINSRLDSLLLEANNRIDEQKVRIDKMTRAEKNTRVLNKKLQAELDELKKMRDQYLEKIDQLLVENESLKKEKQELTSTVETISKNLETTVTTASVLKSEYVKVKTFRKKSSGKYTATALAKRTNKMEVCLTILENKIAQPGEKNVFLRIVEPGGQTMGNRTDGSATFKIPNSDQEVMYTAAGKISYTNVNQDYCLAYEEQERIFTSGTYVIEVYIDGNLSTAASYVLK